MNFTKVITVPEYAKMRGVSNVAVTRALNRGSKLIDVMFAEKIGRDWLLTVSNDVTKKNKGKCVVINE